MTLYSKEEVEHLSEKLENSRSFQRVMEKKFSQYSIMKYFFGILHFFLYFLFKNTAIFSDKHFNT